ASSEPVAPEGIEIPEIPGVPGFDSSPAPASSEPVAPEGIEIPEIPGVPGFDSSPAPTFSEPAAPEGIEIPEIPTVEAGSSPASEAGIEIDVPSFDVPSVEEAPSPPTDSPPATPDMGGIDLSNLQLEAPPSSVEPDMPVEEEVSEPSSSAPAEPTYYEDGIQCPSCGAPNPPNSERCQECRFDFHGMKSAEEMKKKATAPKPRRREPLKTKKKSLAILPVVLVSFLLLIAVGVMLYVFNPDLMESILGSPSFVHVTADQPSAYSHYPRLSPDGLKVTYVNLDGAEQVLMMSVFAGPVPDRTTQEIYRTSGKILTVDWHPNSDQFAFETYETVVIETDTIAAHAIFIFHRFHDLRDGRAIPKLIELHGRHPQWSPSGKHLAYDYQGKLVSYTPRTANPKTVLKTLPNASYPVWLTDEFIIYTQNKRRMVLQPLDDVASVQEIEAGFQESVWTRRLIPMVSPNATQILYSKADYLWVYDVSTQKKEKFGLGTTDIGELEQHFVGNGAAWLDNIHFIYADHVQESGLPKKGGLKVVNTISKATAEVPLKMELSNAGEIHIAGEKITFVGTQDIRGSEGLAIENVFVMDADLVPLP
ncbi:MAG: hypothetical protein D6675_07930, partial [Gemmatimonadetes bacterium]